MINANADTFCLHRLRNLGQRGQKFARNRWIKWVPFRFDAYMIQDRQYYDQTKKGKKDKQRST
jgi:hypothetical protein